MHAGRNFGRIYIDGVYQSFTIDITAGVRDDDGSISDIAVTKDIKECMVGIMELYTSFRLKRIVTGVMGKRDYKHIKPPACTRAG